MFKMIELPDDFKDELITYQGIVYGAALRLSIAELYCDYDRGDKGDAIKVECWGILDSLEIFLKDVIGKNSNLVNMYNESKGIKSKVDG